MTIYQTIEVCVTTPRKILWIIPWAKYHYDQFIRIEADDLKHLHDQMGKIESEFQSMYPNKDIAIYLRSNVLRGT